MAWRKTACITWSINLEVSSLCIATKELRLPSPVRGVQLLKRQKTQPQSFLLAAPSAQRMMRYRRTKVHFQHIELKTNNAMLSLLFLVFFSFISEQEAISYSETRCRVRPNNYCTALWCRPHKVSAIPLGEYGGTTDVSGNRKSVHWYVDYVDQILIFDRHWWKYRHLDFHQYRPVTVT